MLLRPGFERLIHCVKPTPGVGVNLFGLQGYKEGINILYRTSMFAGNIFPIMLQNDVLRSAHGGMVLSPKQVVKSLNDHAHFLWQDIYYKVVRFEADDLTIGFDNQRRL